ncbi:lantibiotic dehydratase family protein [Niabella sp. W65]|nr:lantibiotic dehydratase family protein [Niabella sp. W65]MCH7364073.1 lantibiotic dehydratase family protein [Niabella sp. W65]
MPLYRLAVKNEITFSVKDLLSINAIVIANSSWYAIRENIRYIFRNENGFELSDIVQHPLIMEVLNACKEPIHIVSLRVLLRDTCSADSDFEHLIEGLLGLQLLFTSLQPNIVGEDYFTRIGFTSQEIIDMS